MEVQLHAFVTSDCQTKSTQYAMRRRLGGLHSRTRTVPASWLPGLPALSLATAVTEQSPLQCSLRVVKYSPEQIHHWNKQSRRSSASAQCYITCNQPWLINPTFALSSVWSRTITLKKSELNDFIAKFDIRFTGGLGFSRRWPGGVGSYGIWSRVLRNRNTKVSNEHVTIFRHNESTTETTVRIYETTRRHRPTVIFICSGHWSNSILDKPQ
jgi:hypothetical protein